MSNLRPRPVSQFHFFKSPEKIDHFILKHFSDKSCFPLSCLLLSKYQKKKTDGSHASEREFETDRILRGYERMANLQSSLLLPPNPFSEIRGLRRFFCFELPLLPPPISLWPKKEMGNSKTLNSPQTRHLPVCYF